MAPKANPYDQDLDRNPANFLPLTPLSFLQRTAEVFPERTALVHGRLRSTWAETYARCRRLASALTRRGIGRGDTVSVMLPNVPAMFEVHFGVPMSGAVLNTLNTRLDAASIAFMLGHADAKLLLTDREFSPVIAGALEKLGRPLEVIDLDDPEYSGPGERLGAVSYEQLLEEGDAGAAWPWPEDEWQAISLNYTSGTTG
ncbi:MAG TPA: AMP-binding protein, partial [Myxococcaceae bacterium]|nr:AMP-binding protein [Myxococcaceae bacterium]